MVDFDNETTVGTPAVDVVRILILQRRHDCLEAWEKYNQLKGTTEADTSYFQTRLFTLFMELQATLERRLTEEAYTALYKKCTSGKEEDLQEGFITINKELDKINLTKIDMRKVFDSSRVEKENQIKGL